MSFLATATAIVSTTMAIATAPPPPSDHAVYAAYRSHHHLVSADEKKYYAARRRLLTGPPTDGEVEDFVDSDGEINATLADVARAVKSSRPATHAGALARRYALRQVGAWEDANRSESKMLLAIAHGERGAMLKYDGQIATADKRFNGTIAPVRRWFRKAGYRARALDR